MAKQIITGGTAFPFTPTQDRHSDTSGMTLRDYFASQAMAILDPPSIYASSDDTKASYERFAKRAYSMADAMLEAGGY